MTVMSWGETAHAPVLSVTAVCERQEGGKVWRETLHSSAGRDLSVVRGRLGSTWLLQMEAINWECL